MKRNRFVKTVSTLLFAVVLLLAVNIPVSAAATCNHTLGESISWLESNIGKKLDADGVYPGQCVDLVMKYYDYLVGNHSGVSGNANQYATNKVPAGFTRIKGAGLQPGDIGISTSGQYGHVWIQGYDGYSYHQNYRGLYVSKERNYKPSGYWGVIRPNFKVNATPTPKPAEIPAGQSALPNGTYKIRSAVDENYYLDIYGQSPYSNGAILHLWHKVDCDDQRFIVNQNSAPKGYYSFRNSNTGRYVETNAYHGAIPYVHDRRSGREAFEDFVIEPTDDGYFTIRDRKSGFYLDLKDGVAKDGAEVRLWKGNGAKAQKWFFELDPKAYGKTIPDGTYYLASQCNRNMVLQAKDGAKNGSNVTIGTRTNSKNQIFTVKYVGNGCYNLLLYNTNHYLDLYCGKKERGTNVQLWEYAANDHQKWIISASKTAKDGYNLACISSGNFLDVSGGVANEGTNVRTWTPHCENPEIWVFIPANPNPTATPKPTATPVPTATPKPTATPEPTATPVPTATPEPTATPVPTATPEPTATPVPTATPEPTATPVPTATRKPTDTPAVTTISGQIYGTGLSLKGKFGANVLLGFADEKVVKVYDPSVIIKVEGKETVLKLSEQEHYTSGKGEVYEIQTFVPAKQINDEIELKLVDENGNDIGLRYGKKAMESFTFSINGIISSYLANPDRYDEKTIDLVKAIQNYCGYTQLMTGYKTDTVKVTDDLTDVTVQNLKPYATVADKGSGIAKFAGVGLALQSDTTMQVYFKLMDTADSYSITVNGEAVTPESLGNNQYCVELKSIPAGKLSTASEIVIRKGDETFTIKASALSWAESVLSNSKAQKQTTINMAKMLYRYAQKADIYFGKK